MTDTERELRSQILELQRDVRALEDQLEGNIPGATYWLQTKVVRQRRALDRMNRTLVSQRFVLRTMDGLGRSLTREEYLAARAQQPERLRERIEVPA
jgi:uncharacterized coiled-coil protein SlyX